MRGAAWTMTVLRPKSAREALTVYARTPQAVPFSGGTDLMVTWNLGTMNDRVILDLSALGEWARIENVGAAGSARSLAAARAGAASSRDTARTSRSQERQLANSGADAADAAGAVLRVGALTTHAALQRHAVVRSRFALLAAACATVGGVQIQNRGTIGGNIANASPAGDTLPPLAAYDARIHIASATSRRTVPFLDIFAGVKKTTLQPGELIGAIDLPFPSRAPDREQFRKVGTRAAQAISKTVFAGLLWLSPDDGRVEDVRLALGSMAPTVRRLRHAEQFLTGQPLTAETIGEATALVAKDISPIDDVRSTASYRLQTSQRLVEAFLIGETR